MMQGEEQLSGFCSVCDKRFPEGQGSILLCLCQSCIDQIKKEKRTIKMSTEYEDDGGIITLEF